MAARRVNQLGTVAALLATALAGGAFAAVVGACFIWLYESGIDVVWTTIPERLGIDAYASWWLFAVLIGGGLLVGLGQLLLGNYPEPIGQVIASWKAHGHVEPRTMPATMINSLLSLVAGGPVGFEAALTGLLGGAATLIAARIRAVRHLARQAWGAELADALPKPVRHLPYWLAAVAGLVVYRWMPFGQLDSGFRFGRFDGDLTVSRALLAFGFAAVVAVPVAVAFRFAIKVEQAKPFLRSPVLFAMAGGLAFALLALGNRWVLFSGQSGYQSLPEMSTGALLYLAVAKWLALTIAFGAGWRGGPIFPLFFSVSALGVIVADVVGMDPNIAMVAGSAAVSTVFLRGQVPIACVLTLYVAPFSYVPVILVGSVGAAVALTLARSAGLGPADPDDPDEAGGADEPGGAATTAPDPSPA